MNVGRDEGNDVNVGRNEGNDVNVGKDEIIYNVKSTQTRERTKKKLYTCTAKKIPSLYIFWFEMNFDELSVANAGEYKW